MEDDVIVVFAAVPIPPDNKHRLGVVCCGGEAFRLVCFTRRFGKGGLRRSGSQCAFINHFKTFAGTMPLVHKLLRNASVR